MRTLNHLELAHMLAKRNKLKGLDKTLFILGSVYPDINILTHLRGHYYNQTKDMVYKMIKKCMHKDVNRFKTYWYIGLIQHYVGDYFTYTHTPDFKDNIIEHMKYEARLSIFMKSQFKKHRCKISDSYCKSEQDLILCLESKLLIYDSNKKGYKNDTKFITEMLSLVANTLCREAIK